jgi:peroxiredoxin
LRSFQQRLSDFNASGVHIVAISTDPPDVIRSNRQKLGLTFSFLSDTKTEAIQRYDLLHKNGGPKGNDIARPAEFLIDSTGVIRWVNLTESVTVRARPEQVLKAIEEHKLASPATR